MTAVHNTIPVWREPATLRTCGAPLAPSATESPDEAPTGRSDVRALRPRPAGDGAIAAARTAACLARLRSLTADWLVIRRELASAELTATSAAVRGLRLAPMARRVADLYRGRLEELTAECAAAQASLEMAQAAEVSL